ncbi:hypothetical protein ACFFIS_10005 [Virgibacillus soli]
MPNVRYTISIPSKDLELIHFVKEKRKQNGLSAYIRELVRKDMKNRENLELEQIYEYVIKKLKEDGYTMKEIAAKKVTDFIDEADKDIIMDLF